MGDIDILANRPKFNRPTQEYIFSGSQFRGGNDLSYVRFSKSGTYIDICNGGIDISSSVVNINNAVNISGNTSIGGTLSIGGGSVVVFFVGRAEEEAVVSLSSVVWLHSAAAGSTTTQLNRGAVASLSVVAQSHSRAV